MSVIQQLQNLIGSTRIGGIGAPTSTTAASNQAELTARADYRDARIRLLRLYNHLENLAELAGIDTRFKLDLPDAQSSSALGLDLTHTAAALNSSAEINAAPHSFSPFGPEWDDGSSALMTISGEYDGSNGSGAFGLEVRWPGTHGVDDLRIRFETPGGSRIRNVNIRDHHDPDRLYSLNNGLFLQLGPGSLINRDFATLNLSAGIGAAVDPDKPLGGIRNDNPNFEYGMPAVVDGSFSINGESITVNTSDTLNDIVNRVNLSNAGVTATFNALTEQVEFLQNTLGEVPTIDLQNDTSNFLQAAKLDNLNLVAGIDPETIQTLDRVGQFSTVTSGDILVNGHTISIDTAVDSLETVIDKINAAPARVTASFDEGSQLVTLTPDASVTRFEIDSNGTGLFAALNLAEGRLDPEQEARGISRRRSYDIADAFAAAFDELNSLFRDGTFDGGALNVGAVRAPIETALRRTYGDGERSSVFGLTFDAGIDARKRGGLLDVNRKALTRELQIRGEQVKDVLAGRDNGSGLIHDLLGATRQALTNVNKALNISGTFVDTFA